MFEQQLAMIDPRMLELLMDLGAIVKGHFVLASGVHSEYYFNKDALYADPTTISEICLELAKQFVGKNIDVVVAPAVGGAILTSRIAEHLGTLENRKIISIFADKGKDNDGNDIFIIKRGYDKFVPGKNILIAEDVTTSTHGGSMSKVVNAVNELNGNIAGLSIICNRGGITSANVGLDDNMPLYSWLELDIPTYPAEDCPLCAAGIPPNADLGKGATFLANQQKI